ncbi:MAG: hypothetical protein H6953_10940 [Chromatiaceae bacterium]|nr:hypothetical protein [Chromatiaceae bacterium]MCP5312808.1 hypothetical protein [Chromatiaceae bacterium]
MTAGRLLVLFCGVLCGLPPIAAASPPVATTLRFATACAHCHEGECSGRLSFARRPETAYTHIRQYAGPVDDAFAGSLYAALERMKADCSYPPVPVPTLVQTLTGDDLLAYRDRWSADYFLPLGDLPAGRYRLRLDLDGSGSVRVELIDAEFDPLLDQCMSATGHGLETTLNLTTRHPHFLRLRPRATLQILGLQISPDGPDEPPRDPSTP